MGLVRDPTPPAPGPTFKGPCGAPLPAAAAFEPSMPHGLKVCPLATASMIFSLSHSLCALAGFFLVSYRTQRARPARQLHRGAHVLHAARQMSTRHWHQRQAARGGRVKPEGAREQVLFVSSDRADAVLACVPPCVLGAGRLPNLGSHFPSMENDYLSCVRAHLNAVLLRALRGGRTLHSCGQGRFSAQTAAPAHHAALHCRYRRYSRVAV